MIVLVYLEIHGVLNWLGKVSEKKIMIRFSDDHGLKKNSPLMSSHTTTFHLHRSLKPSWLSLQAADSDELCYPLLAVDSEDSVFPSSRPTPLLSILLINTIFELSMGKGVHTERPWVDFIQSDLGRPCSSTLQQPHMS